MMDTQICGNFSQAERAEKEKVKRMTLEINERQEEEEAAEIMQQVISWSYDEIFLSSVFLAHLRCLFPYYYYVYRFLISVVDGVAARYLHNTY